MLLGIVDLASSPSPIRLHSFSSKPQQAAVVAMVTKSAAELCKLGLSSICSEWWMFTGSLYKHTVAPDGNGNGNLPWLFVLLGDIFPGCVCAASVD